MDPKPDPIAPLTPTPVPIPVSPPKKQYLGLVFPQIIAILRIIMIIGCVFLVYTYVVVQPWYTVQAHEFCAEEAPSLPGLLNNSLIIEPNVPMQEIYNESNFTLNASKPLIR